MATPVGRYVRESLPTVRNTMLDLLFVRVGLVICLADTFGDHFRIALFMAGVLAIGTLHTGSIL